MEELLNIQAELKSPKNQVNSFGRYNYRSAEDILEAVKPLLKRYGCILTLTDTIESLDGILFVNVTATLTKDKESITTQAQAGINPNKKGMDISQSFGSSSSYARKYALNGLFLIDDTKDADTQDNSNENKAPKPSGRLNYTELAKNCRTIGELETWFKNLSNEEQRKASAVTKNRKNEIMNSSVPF